MCSALPESSCFFNAINLRPNHLFKKAPSVKPGNLLLNRVSIPHWEQARNNIT